LFFQIMFDLQAAHTKVLGCWKSQKRGKSNLYPGRRKKKRRERSLSSYFFILMIFILISRLPFLIPKATFYQVGASEL
jgi:hypothetical protein